MNIAIVQAAPVHLNLSESLDKALNLITAAAQKGANLIVFGETWLSGYPAWIDHCPEIALWNNKVVADLFVQMHGNSVAVPGKEVKQLAELCKQLNVVVGIGINEIVPKGPGSGTIYNSFLLIGTTGEVLIHHRKLMPTFNEKLFYGQGDGYGLRSAETPFGHIGGLICWEHWMPLTRQALHNSAETIHLALWPSVNELHQLASRHYAVEGRCFVVAAGQVMLVKDIPSQLTLPPALQNKPEHFILSGGSCIINPSGDYLLQPQFDTEDIFICEIPNLKDAIKGKMTLDISGHYNRPDVLNFSVNRHRTGIDS